MECDKCGKKITLGDVPSYLVSLHAYERVVDELKAKGHDVYLLCKICRAPIEEKEQDEPWEELKKRLMIFPTWWIKFTCHHCGARQTSEQPNTLFTMGFTCEECGRTSIPGKFGCVTATLLGGSEFRRLRKRWLV